MKRKKRPQDLPTLDELYHQLKEIESALSGLGALLMASRSSHEDLPIPIDLEGIGMILVLTRKKIRCVASHVSTHALYSGK